MIIYIKKKCTQIQSNNDSRYQLLRGKAKRILIRTLKIKQSNTVKVHAAIQQRKTDSLKILHYSRFL